MSLDVYLKRNITDDALFNMDEVRHLAVKYAITSLHNPYINFNSWFVHISPSWRETANMNNPEWKYPNETVYWANITHNLGAMAKEAEIYYYLWRPEEISVTKAEQLIEPLTQGLKLLKAFPEKYKKFNSPNGWGMYEHFVPFVEEYLKACIKYPDTTIEVSR